MQDIPNLGGVPEADAKRDAIHVAIAPCCAGADLDPGQRVVLKCGLAYPGVPGIGIVDPFLMKKVLSGQRFWLCLLPGSVTSLRHEWTCPAFEPSDDEKWLRSFANSIDVSLEELIEAAKTYSESGVTTYVRHEGIYNIPYGSWEEFWTRLESYTGIPAEDRDSNVFRCGC